MLFKIYTDGGCSGNKRDAGCRGAWAYLILDPANNIIKFQNGLVQNTTNNRMEMQAVVMGLRALNIIASETVGSSSKMHDCLVVSDSKYVINNFTDHLPSWKLNGWRRSQGSEVVNIDLWKDMSEASEPFKSFSFKWVKGHSTNKFNQKADALVRELLY